ncbi:hypothetical protein H4R35_004292 [Dimargaris xerosporica]|nr:hypothetical protein H4R35_004292 [Dimargaris xerosporica]
MFGRFASNGTATRRSRLIWSYAPDWILVIIMALGFFAIDKIHPFQRQFSLADKSIQYPMKPDTVTPAMLIVVSFLVPIASVFVVAVFHRRSWFDLHQGWLGCMLALTMTIIVTHTIKITAGRHRPDFLSRCKLDLSDGNTPEDPIYGLSTTAICTQTNEKIMREGMKSFPSGHASLSFAGLTYLTLYLAGKLHLYDQRGHTIKTFVVIMPLLGALLVAVSRTVDYRHHWQDVTVGSIIGIVCAYFAYRQYYPNLASPLAHRPYSPRIPSEDGTSDLTINPETPNGDSILPTTVDPLPKPGRYMYANTGLTSSSSHRDVANAAGYGHGGRASEEQLAPEFAPSPARTPYQTNASTQYLNPPRDPAPRYSAESDKLSTTSEVELLGGISRPLRSPRGGPPPRQ